MRELRRGSDPAKIYSLAFSHGDMPNWVAVTSDKGTAHIFSLSGRRQQAGGSRDATTGGSNGGGSSSSSTQQQQGDSREKLSGSGRSYNPVSTLSFVSVSRAGLQS